MDEREKRLVVEELVEAIVFFPDHLEVKVSRAPRLNVLLGEVGLREDLPKTKAETLSNVGVGGGI